MNNREIRIERNGASQHDIENLSVSFLVHPRDTGGKLSMATVAARSETTFDPIFRKNEDVLIYVCEGDIEIRLPGDVKQLSSRDLAFIPRDLGGPVAYATAASTPGLVKGLLLFEAPLFGVRTEGVPDFERDYWHFGFHACPDLAEALIAGREDVYLQHFFSEFSYRKDAFAPELIERFSDQMKRPGALRGGLAHYRSIKQSRRQMEQWMTKKLAIPVGGFGGSHSLAEAVLRSVEQVSERPFGGIIESCGHWVCEERPEVVLQQIERLFTEIGTWYEM